MARRGTRPAHCPDGCRRHLPAGRLERQRDFLLAYPMSAWWLGRPDHRFDGTRRCPVRVSGTARGDLLGAVFRMSARPPGRDVPTRPVLQASGYRAEALHAEDYDLWTRLRAANKARQHSGHPARAAQARFECPRSGRPLFTGTMRSRSPADGCRRRSGGRCSGDRPDSG